jgi:hypothetical protein
MTCLATTNTAWGFWGSMAHHVDPDAAWPVAMAKVAEATSLPETAVRDFLDSRHGRHFADTVVDNVNAGQQLDPAIAAAIDTWMGWRIGRSMARETGIPHGLPYLTGLVGQMQVEAELEADDAA